MENLRAYTRPTEMQSAFWQALQIIYMHIQVLEAFVSLYAY